MGDLSAQTDESGRYDFATLEPGVYLVTASLDRYVSQEREVTVSEAAPVTLDFQMQREKGTVARLVKDASTDEAIPGASVQVGDESTVTNDSGDYKLILDTGTYIVTVSADKYVQQEQTATVTVDATVTLDFSLEPMQGTIAGTVTDAGTRVSIPGAAVQIADSSTQTNPEGKYQLSLSPGDYAVIISADKYVQQEQSATVSSDEATILDFSLEPIKGTTAGTVTDADTGDLITGATVQANGSSAQTDAAGAYQLTLRPGDYTVTASADKYVLQGQTVTVNAGETTTLDFSLKPGQSEIAGTVTDAKTSEPITEATVQVAGGSIQTGAEGKYQLTLDPGDYTVTVSADKYVQQEQAVTISADETVTLDFSLELMRGIIVGIVKDSDTGNPIPEATAQVGDSSAQTDAEGKYQHTLEPGDYIVTVSLDKYVQQEQATTATADGTVTLDFSLELIKGIATGTVRDVTDNPISGATVQVGDSSAQTDAKGKYQFILKPGDYTIAVSVEKYVSQDKSMIIKLEETTTLDFELKLMDGILSGTIIDKITNAGTLKPVSGAVVEVVARGVPVQVETDSQGRFELSLPPDTYNMTASAREYLIEGEVVVEIEPGVPTELPRPLLALPAVEVWPGDTNDDGRVSILDILPIGRFWGKTVDERRPPGDEWQMGLTLIGDWEPREAAFADADGNRIVNEEDVTAIVENWRKQRSEGTSTPGPMDTLKLLADESMLDKCRKMYQVVSEMGDSEGAIVVREALKSLITELKPKESVLLVNYPNPFNPDTWIPFVLAQEREVMIRIYDVSGRLVREMTLGRLEPGYYTQKDRAAYWDGMTDAGERVSSGIYFYSIQAGGYSATRKMITIR